MSEREELSDIIFYSADWSDIRSGSDEAADLILAAGYRKHRVVSTVEELGKLPDGTAFNCKHGGVGELNTVQGFRRVFWIGNECEDPLGLWMLPATVLHVPEVTE